MSAARHHTVTGRHVVGAFFHVLLMLFGWGVRLWSVPALAILVPLAAHDLRPVSPEAALQDAA